MVITLAQDEGDLAWSQVGEVPSRSLLKYLLPYISEIEDMSRIVKRRFRHQARFIKVPKMY
jgi:hypothetical protein